MHHGAQTSASKMPSSGPYFPREEGKTSTVKSPCFLHFGDRPRTGKAISLSSVPWGCPLWGQWALWGSWLLVPSLLKKPVSWVPPAGQQAPYRPSRGAAVGEREQMQPPGSLCTAGNQRPGREFAYGGLFGTKAVP